MPSNQFRSADVQCPFFHACGKAQRISCEGPEDGVSVILCFATRHKWEVYKKRHCDLGYAQCRVYRMAMDKYEE